MSAVNKVLEWITKMAYLNILWLVFTILGIGIFGLFPSITATFTVIHKWLNGEVDIPVSKTFWSSYKKEFLKSNILGYIIVVFGVIIYLDLLVFNASSNRFVNLLTIPLVGITMIYVLTSFYIFPTLVHYDLKLVQVIKNSFLIMILNPLPTIIMLVGAIGISFVFLNFQGLIPLFSVSLLSFTITMPAIRAFENISKKHEKFVVNGTN